LKARLIALVPAAGGGTRFGGTAPKQYAVLVGKPVLAWTLDRLRDALDIERTAVAIAPDDLHYEREIGTRDNVMVLRSGGPTTCRDDDWILVHDAARPCVPSDALARLVAHLEHDATGGLLAIPAADTLKRSDGDVDAPRVLRTEDRAGLWQAQTPQMFRYGVLVRACGQASQDWTDESQAVEALGLRPRLVRGSQANVKVTYPDDLQLAAAILASQATSGNAR